MRSIKWMFNMCMSVQLVSTMTSKPFFWIDQEQDKYSKTSKKHRTAIFPSFQQYVTLYLCHFSIFLLENTMKSQETSPYIPISLGELPTAETKLDD